MSLEITETEAALNATEVEHLDERIVELAMRAAHAENGGLFVRAGDSHNLVIHSHAVEGLAINLPDVTVRPRNDGRPNGIALHVLERGATYVCADTRCDPHYARYFVDLGSIVGVPIRYQKRVIGVLTVGSRSRDAFDANDVAAIEAVAAAAAKHMRRAELYRASRGKRPFLIKGMSPEWLEVERRIENVSPTNAPVLIRGESGTGKELVAHAIHFNSTRADRPLVTVNCAAIPETMLESILFGHIKGAFTGATFTKVGEFQKADGGTLFLDEVGELPMMLQAKVLRAVEQGELQPLGSNAAPTTVDVRLICATNRDLEAMSRSGQFRDDLYYRLSVMTIAIPPLRSYKDNLEVLANVFLEQTAHRYDKSARRLSPAARALLAAYDFPGNVRELKNAIEHAVIMASGDEIAPDDLPHTITGARRVPGPATTAPGSLRHMREVWLAPRERRYLEELLAACDGNVRAAARRAGVNTVTLYRLLKKRGLRLAREIHDAAPKEQSFGD